MQGCAGGLSLCSILQKYFPFLLPPISKQNQPHNGGAVVWQLCLPSWAAQTLTQSRRWTAARFPGLSMPCGWDQYLAKMGKCIQLCWTGCSSYVAGKVFHFPLNSYSIFPTPFANLWLHKHLWVGLFIIHMNDVGAAGLGTRSVCIQALYPAMQGTPWRNIPDHQLRNG